MNLRKWTPRRIYLAIKRRLSPFARLVRQGRISVGEGTYGSPNIATFAGDSQTRLIIGRYCSIASTATFLLGGNHPTDRRSTYPIRQRMVLAGRGLDGFPSSRGDIVVGNDVWIGHEALILSGVTIGDGAVVAARSVVSRDVEPFTIVAGNPARHIRQRLSEIQQRQISEMRWWEWPRDVIEQHVGELNDEVLD